MNDGLAREFEHLIRNGSQERVRQSRRRRAAGANCIQEGVRQYRQREVSRSL